MDEFTVDEEIRDFKLLRLQDLLESCKLIITDPARGHFAGCALLAVDLVI
jgi:hypothetical protein